VIEDEPQCCSVCVASSWRIRSGHGIGRRTASPSVSTAPDLVILDVTLPLNGFEVCRVAREGPADAGGHAHRAVARDRRCSASGRTTTPAVQHHQVLAGCAPCCAARRRPSGLETCRIGDVEIDFRTHQAHRAGQRLDFTAREFDLLRYFVAHTGQVVTREQILNQVWGYEESPTTRTIANFVAKLRQKIERSPHEPEHILTVHGAGYKCVG
jgi:two-component system alkaline phosphatase synthesis response regulator PhoP